MITSQFIIHQQCVLRCNIFIVQESTVSNTSYYFTIYFSILQVVPTIQCEVSDEGNSDTSAGSLSDSYKKYVSESEQMLHSQQRILSHWYFFKVIFFFFSRIFEGYCKGNLFLPVFKKGKTTLLPIQKVKTLLLPHPPESSVKNCSNKCGT